MRRRSSDSGAQRRAGRVPAWLPLGLLLAGFLWMLQNLQDSAEARGVGRIEVARYRLDHGDRYFPAPWRARLERVLARLQVLDADDDLARERLLLELVSLPFVDEVGEVEVLWPDGLIVPLALHEPTACIKVGEDYLPVADDGTVLPGYTYAPPEVYGAYLPTLGPHRLVAELDPQPLPGDALEDTRLLDALTVARSLQRYLTPDQQLRLGRVLIDASEPMAVDGMPGGVRLELEGARRILFGRPPDSGRPGEMPSAVKWQHVARGLDELVAGQRWDVYDVRWDEPVGALRGAGEPPR